MQYRQGAKMARKYGKKGVGAPHLGSASDSVGPRAEEEYHK